jgi:hypothetical protein
MTLAVAISTSPAELRFLRAQLDQCALFASHVVVACGSHRFDGVTPEPLDGIRQVAKDYPHVRFLVFSVLPPHEVQNPLKQRPAAMWHNVARIVATRPLWEMEDRSDWLMYLDGDEVPDGAVVRAWAAATLSASPKGDAGYALANYWYFREPVYRAKALEQSVMVVPMSLFPRADDVERVLMHDFERYGLADHLKLQTFTVGVDGTPMIHHFSWVRSKEAILAKVATWGHQHDRPWKEMIEEAWDRPFEGTDFVHGYEYEEVENRFGV